MKMIIGDFASECVHDYKVCLDSVMILVTIGGDFCYYDVDDIARDGKVKMRM